MSTILVSPTTPNPALASLRTKDIPRRPSPWHEIAHSLSTTSLPPTRNRSRSSSSSISLPTPTDDQGDPTTTILSTSQALREWEERLQHPQSDAIRHQLSFPLVPTRKTSTPKLAAERDRAGYIEYKLKLIDPTPERFEKLVTQMMWRLKQGRNEAIYEIGLADDGTVVGLTRKEMDASLRTLELMASVVGATVLILKEIVLTGAARIHPASLHTLPSASSSSSPSTHSTSHASAASSSACVTPGNNIIDGTKLEERGYDVEQEMAQRTMRTADTQLQLDLGGKSGRREKELDIEGQVEDASTALEDVVLSPGIVSTPGSSAGMVSEGEPFVFHMDDDLSASQPNKNSYTIKGDKKRRKSLARQEQRRLDLLKGDGTNPFWQELSKVSVNQEMTTAPRGHHKPIRPSSLRLATPAESPEHSFLDDLLHIPLDSLSLSFADVTTISASSSASSSPSAKTEYASVVDSAVEEDTSRAGCEVHREEEKICVEALVVRKPQYDHGIGIVEGEVEEEDWSFGGEEDAWGFGGEDD